MARKKSAIAHHVAKAPTAEQQQAIVHTNLTDNQQETAPVSA